ncbi:MAG TPA: YwiC-like family protein [Methanocella sp.]|uniref:YwiC-like family protein n=1 Tax=Methanocella sp. TaxID=2052833 RepID=UPI002BE5BDFE|nr:YwiC-like family protein [Methanocella sp.]HTY91683.1 YwiC-like family protein [Methanocella sp.]
MLEELFFAIGLVNSVLLIAIFLLAKKKRMDDVSRVGKVYLLLAIPALYGLYLVAEEKKSWQFGVFLGIFITYLALEALYDFVLKLDFRHNWKQLLPYLCLYFAMNYGFVVMVWKWSLLPGLLMLALFVAQIAINIWANHADILKRRDKRSLNGRP